MNEVRSRAEGILHVVENRQRIAKSVAIVVAHNNVAGRPSIHQEAKEKANEKQQKPVSKFEPRKSPADYQSNLKKI